MSHCEAECSAVCNVDLLTTWDFNIETRQVEICDRSRDRRTVEVDNTGAVCRGARETEIETVVSGVDDLAIERRAGERRCDCDELGSGGGGEGKETENVDHD